MSNAVDGVGLDTSGRVFQNKKNKMYYVFMGIALDCTNRRDGEKVAMYYRPDAPHRVYLREIDEFMAKFDEITPAAIDCGGEA